MTKKRHRYTFQSLEGNYSEENLKKLQRLSKSVSKEMSDAWLRLRDLQTINLEYSDGKTYDKIVAILEKLAWNELNSRQVYALAAIAQNEYDYNRVFANDAGGSYDSFISMIQEPIEALEKEVAERIQDEPVVCGLYDDEELEDLVKNHPSLLVSNAADAIKELNNWL